MIEFRNMIVGCEMMIEDEQTRKRDTIGFLTTNIHTGASRGLWLGILETAVSQNINLICYAGGHINASDPSAAMRNIIYDQVDTHQIDGLIIWTSALEGARMPNNSASFYTKYNHLPIVDLASFAGFEPMVTIDGTEGMRALMLHLIEKHGYQKIAFIRGPEGHQYEQERYGAFLEILAEKNIPFDEKLISPSLGWDKGAEALSVLLNERGLTVGQDFQAIVAASDLLAIGAIRLLTERGIRMPDDVAVVGFNDIEEGRLVRPPLTSVSLPFYEQGSRAVATLGAMLQHEDVPQVITLNSRLVIRQSCGCPSWSELLAMANLTAVSTPTASRTNAQRRIEGELSQIIADPQMVALWVTAFLDAFEEDIYHGKNGRFRTTLDRMLHQSSLNSDEISAWQNSISILRAELFPVLNANQRVKATALFGQAHVVIGDAVQRVKIAQQLAAQRQSAALRDIGQALSTTFHIAKLAAVLADRLPELGIRSAYVALYENVARPLDGARLMMAYTDDQRFALGENGRLLPPNQLIPPDLLPQRRHTLLAEPLYFQNEHLGVVVFEVGPHDGNLYDVLRSHISSAVKGALLFQDAHQARRHAEKADQIKTRLLANVSHELRTPLNIIINHVQKLGSTHVPTDWQDDLSHIEQNAAHQLRLINDLLDISRAEINALDLYPVMLDPLALMGDVFASMAKDAKATVAWQLQLPEKLPFLEADPVRLRQILLNLLSNSARFTTAGQITLGAEVIDARLHIWVADTGAGIPPAIVTHIYKPFVTQETAVSPPTGIGLGLSIAKHLVSLHHGEITVESREGKGTTFHIYLPLPAKALQSLPPTPPLDQADIWLISRRDQPNQVQPAMAHPHQLIHPESLWEKQLQYGVPTAVMWDTNGTKSGDWTLLRRLHNHPKLASVPFILVHQGAAMETAVGLTSVVVKPASPQALWSAIQPAAPQEKSGTVLIIDDDPDARRFTYEAVQKGLPAYAIVTAANGEEGLAAMMQTRPNLVVLDLMMPKMDGFELLEMMRANEQTRHLPVVILSSRRLSLADIKRLEAFSVVALRSKQVFTQDEIATSVHKALFGTDRLPTHMSTLIKRSLAYLHQNYQRPLTRQEIAEALSLSEDYFSRTFHVELGISPWDYLNRYRIGQAKQLLLSTAHPMQWISRQVGFSDPAYFSRVFRRLEGQTPTAYRKQNGR